MADTTGTLWQQLKVLARKGTGTQGQSFGGGSTAAGYVALYDAAGNVIGAQPRGNTTVAQLADLTGGFTAGNVLIFDAFGNATDGAVLLSTLTGAGTIVSEVPVGLLNGINVTFTLTFTPFANSLILFLNGVEQVPGVDYTLATNTITMTVAPKARDTGYWIARYQH